MAERQGNCFVISRLEVRFLLWAPNKMKKLLIQLTIFMAVSAILVAPTYVFASNDLLCMAKNIYFEARGESEAGQFMVGFVTMNRVRDSRWPDTVCKVVYQDNQFEWTQNTHSNTPFKGELFNRMIYIASIVIQANTVNHYGYYFKGVGHKSRFFKDKTLLAIVGNHEFYE